MMALIYLKRLNKQDPNYLQCVASSDLFVVSTMVASKFLFDDGTDDECYNDDWACGVGMDLEKLNRLEIDFLNALSWNLNVSKSDFDAQLCQIESELSKIQMERTNLFTYNNARNINLSIPLYYLISLVSKVFMFSAFATLFFVKCLDKTTEMASTQANTVLLSRTTIASTPNEINSTLASNSTQLDIDYENESLETEKVAENDNDIVIREKCFKRPKCHPFEPIQRLLSFNLSYCII